MKDHYRQAAGSARQQQTMNRLQHCSWERQARLNWAFIAILVAAGFFGTLGLWSILP